MFYTLITKTPVSHFLVQQKIKINEWTHSVNCVVKFYILNLLLWLNFDLFCLLFYRDDIVIFNYICSYLWQQIRSTDHTVHSVVKGKHGLHSNGRLLLFNNHLLSLIPLSTYLQFFSKQLNNTVIWFWGFYFLFWKVTCINNIKNNARKTSFEIHNI